MDVWPGIGRYTMAICCNFAQVPETKSGVMIIDNEHDVTYRTVYRHFNVILYERVCVVGCEFIQLANISTYPMDFEVILMIGGVMLSSLQ